MQMLREKQDIDHNRRTFIKASFALVGVFVLGKVSSLFPAASPIASPISGVGNRKYQNTHYGFSLLYPGYLDIATFDEGGGATTVTFQNVEKAEGFQVYISPYTEAQAGPQLMGGEPSSIHNSLSHIAASGATGSAFHSIHPDLGTTSEVRFVHRGFHYELTAPKPLHTQLGNIVDSWKFV